MVRQGAERDLRGALATAQVADTCAGTMESAWRAHGDGVETAWRRRGDGVEISPCSGHSMVMEPYTDAEGDD
jgi:hypothetical protein